MSFDRASISKIEADACLCGFVCHQELEGRKDTPFATEC